MSARLRLLRVSRAGRTAPRGGASGCARRDRPVRRRTDGDRGNADPYGLACDRTNQLPEFRSTADAADRPRRRRQRDVPERTVTALTITRAGPLTTLQDAGRFGMLAHGVSASGPMDRGAFTAAGALLQHRGTTGIEFTAAGMAFRVDGPLRVGCAGGQFTLSVNGNPQEWPAQLGLAE